MGWSLIDIVHDLILCPLFYVFSGPSETALVAAIAFSAVAFSMLVIFGACIGYARLSKMRKGKV